MSSPILDAKQGADNPQDDAHYYVHTVGIFARRWWRGSISPSVTH